MLGGGIAPARSTVLEYSTVVVFGTSKACNFLAYVINSSSSRDSYPPPLFQRARVHKKIWLISRAAWLLTRDEYRYDRDMTWHHVSVLLPLLQFLTNSALRRACLHPVLWANAKVAATRN